MLAQLSAAQLDFLSASERPPRLDTSIPTKRDPASTTAGISSRVEALQRCQAEDLRLPPASESNNLVCCGRSRVQSYSRTKSPTCSLTMLTPSG